MKKFILIITLLITSSCATKNKMKTNHDYRKAGTSVKVKGKIIKLYRKGSLKVGDNFLKKVKKTDIGFKFNNKVTVVSIVPSIDTKVCEAQTHILGETKEIDQTIDLITISRDLPMAQGRFSKEAKLTNIKYYSDYKTASFGKKTGLLINSKALLARSILVLDDKGIVRYLQIVSELTELPDMAKAFSFANGLLKK